MRTVRLLFYLASIFWGYLAQFLHPPQQGANTEKSAEKTASSPVFEPLDRWKAAVTAGDKSALADLYMKTPPALAKTPQGQTQDPAEAPGYWSSLRPGRPNHFDVHILEVKNLQPGVKALVLRHDL